MAKRKITKEDLKKRKKMLIGVYLLILALWFLSGIIYFSSSQATFDVTKSFEEQFDSNEELRAYLEARGLEGKDTTTPKIVFGFGTFTILLAGGLTFVSFKQDEKRLKI